MYKFPDIKVDMMYGKVKLATIRRLYDGPEQYRVNFNVENTTKALEEGLDEFAIDGWLLMDLGYVPSHLNYRGPEAPNMIWDRVPDKDAYHPLLEEYQIEIDPLTGEYDRLDFLISHYREDNQDKFGIWFKLSEE